MKRALVARVAARVVALLGPLLSAACGGATLPPDPDGGVDGGPPCTLEIAPEDELPEPARRTPRWAFEPWISKDISDRADTLAFVAGFRERGIPVGAVVLDSPWDRQYTTFQPNPSRYPDFADMVAMLHADEVRVVLWTTAMVNRSSFDLEAGGDRYRGEAPNFAEGVACDLFVNDGEVYSWWKGNGASVDFFDPRARAWWHAQQESLLAMGVDGWKLDFGESYLEDDAILETEVGPIAHQRYGEEYYRDFLAYGVASRGRDFTTMVRAWDESYDRRGRFHARPEHAPVAWMGDNHRDWSGLIDALDHLFRSATAGYVVLGSDIGGYLDRDQDNLLIAIPFDLEAFQRWTALGAMTPFMQLHGRGNLAPWTVPGTSAEQDETVAIWRYWATLHTALVPFFYSLAEDAYASPELDSILRPVADEASWAGDWRFLVGDAFLVAPVIAAGGARDVALPAGARWYDWWHPEQDAIEGGTILTAYDASDRLRIPLFVREGAIVPMDVEDDVNDLGSSASAEHLTLLIWPAEAETTFRLREGDDDAITTITTSRDAAGEHVALAPAHGAVIVRLHRDTMPATVRADAIALPSVLDRAALDAAPSGWWYDASTRALWIRSTAPVAAIDAE